MRRATIGPTSGTSSKAASSGGHQRVERAEVPRQRARGGFADVADAEREQQRSSVVSRLFAMASIRFSAHLLATLPGLHRLRHGAVALVGAPAHLQEIGQLQAVDVGDGVEVAEFDRGRRSGDRPGPSMSIARARRSGSAACLRCAGQYRPPLQREAGLALLAHDWRAAHRALGRHRVGRD
jgi:hypothetical protein